MVSDDAWKSIDGMLWVSMVVGWPEKKERD